MALIFASLRLRFFSHPTAHDKVTDHKERRQGLPFRGVKDLSVNESARIVDIDNTVGFGAAGFVAFFQLLGELLTGAPGLPYLLPYRAV